MNYFITGSTGFLGGALTETLLAQGESVVAYGRNTRELARLQALGAEVVKGTLSERQLLLESIPEEAMVIHCGALSSPWGTASDYYESNVLGTQNLASAAMDRGARRFIHISTPSIYVEKTSKENIRESDPLPVQMINLYADSKLKAEHIIDEYTQAGLPAVTLRPQGIFGPRDTAIIPRLIRVAKKGFIPVMNERVKIDLTHIDNVVEAILCALQSPANCNGQKYNITNGEPVDQLETMIALMHRLGYPVKPKRIPLNRAWKIAGLLEWAHRTLPLNGEPLLTRYSVCTLAFTRTLSIEKAIKELGYRPKVSMTEGLERTIPWFARSVS